MPLPSGGAGNGTVYASNKQFASGFTWARTGTSLLEFRFGWGATRGRQEPGGARHAERLRDVRHHRPADRPADLRRPADDSSSRGYADLGRQATNPQWQYPTMWNPKVNYTWVTGRHSLKTGLRVPAHLDRGAGRQPALRPRRLRRPVHPADRRLVEQPLQPGRLHVRLPQPVRAQQHPDRQPAAADALHLPPGRLAGERTT